MEMPETARTISNFSPTRKITGESKSHSCVIEGNIDGVEHMPLKLFHSLTHKLVQLIEILDAG